MPPIESSLTQRKSCLYLININYLHYTDKGQSLTLFSSNLLLSRIANRFPGKFDWLPFVFLYVIASARSYPLTFDSNKSFLLEFHTSIRYPCLHGCDFTGRWEVCAVKMYNDFLLNPIGYLCHIDWWRSRPPAGKFEIWAVICFFFSLYLPVRFGGSCLWSIKLVQIGFD